MLKKSIIINCSIWGCAALLCFGCDATGENNDGSEQESCLVGDSRDCTCDSGTEGTQLCSELDEVWGVCECDFAFMRFCHAILFDNKPEDAWIEITNGKDTVILTAMTEECDTIVGDPCAKVPAGENVTITFGTKEDIMLGPFNNLRVNGGESHAFVVTFENGQPLTLLGQFPLDNASPPGGFGGWATETCEQFSIF